MNALDATYNAVHDYPGGAAALAPRMNRSHQALSAEVKPVGEGEESRLRVTTMRRVMAMSCDLRPLQALAAEFGQQMLPLPVVEEVGEESAMHMAAVMRECAEVLSQASESLKDGRVKDHELVDLERRGGDLVATVSQMTGHFRALNARYRAACAQGRGDVVTPLHQRG